MSQYIVSIDDDNNILSISSNNNNTCAYAYDTVLQIRDSRFLSGAVWPSPDTTFRPTPLTRARVRAGQRMTPNEEKVSIDEAVFGVARDVPVAATARSTVLSPNLSWS